MNPVVDATVIENPLPSTFDVPTAPVKDDVLETLKRAKARLIEGHSVTSYVFMGQVCAVGAIMAVTNTTRSELYEQAPNYVKETYKLLDEVAMELFPQYMYAFNNPRDKGAKVKPGDRIEDVNQVLTADLISEDPEFHSRKHLARRNVLRCYDKAIERREAQING